MTEVNLLTLADVASRIGCSTKTLHGHVRAGDLEGIVVGGGATKARRRFTEEAVEKFLRRQARLDAPESRAQAEELLPRQARRETPAVSKAPGGRRELTPLTPKLVESIRASAAMGETTRAISRAHKMSERRVWKVILSNAD